MSCWIVYVELTSGEVLPRPVDKGDAEEAAHAALESLRPKGRKKLTVRSVRVVPVDYLYEWLGEGLPLTSEPRPAS